MRIIKSTIEKAFKSYVKALPELNEWGNPVEDAFRAGADWQLEHDVELCKAQVFELTSKRGGRIKTSTWKVGEGVAALIREQSEKMRIPK